MEYILLFVLFAALFFADGLPGKKLRSRKAGVLYIALGALSLGGLICALYFKNVPTLTGLMLRWFS